MRLVLRAVDVVEVVGGDERQADLRREAQQLLVEAVLVRDAVVLELEEEVARAEDVAVAARHPAREIPILRLERARDLPVEAGRQADQALAVLRQVVAVDARLVVVAVEVGVGDDAAEVLVAPPVLGQQDQVVRLRVLAAVAVGHLPAGDVGLDPDDRLDLALAAGLVEGDGAVQRAVVGDRERIEAERRSLSDQVVDAAEAVEQAELGVDVEVREVVRRHRHRRFSPPNLPSRRTAPNVPSRRRRRPSSCTKSPPKSAAPVDELCTGWRL